MPELKCTVQNCMHNQNYYCNLDSIRVGGDQAKMHPTHAVTALRRENPEHLQMRPWRLLLSARLTVRLRNAVTMKTANVMQEDQCRRWRGMQLRRDRVRNFPVPVRKK